RIYVSLPCLALHQHPHSFPTRRSSDLRHHGELAHHRIAQVLRRRLLRAVEQLVAIDDLQHAALVGAVAEIDAVALRAGRDRAVRSEEHTSELQSLTNIVCRLLPANKKD